MCLPVSGPEGRGQGAGEGDSVGKERGVNAHGAPHIAEVRERPEASATLDTTLPDWGQKLADTWDQLLGLCPSLSGP